MSELPAFPIVRPVEPQIDNGNRAEPIDLTELFGAIWRDKIRILAAALIGGTLALGWAANFVEPMYQSTAVIIMDAPQDPTLELEAFVPGLTGDNSAVNTEIEILSSRSLLGTVIDDLDLIVDPEFNSLLATPFYAPTIKALRRFGLWPAAKLNPPNIATQIEKTVTIDGLADHISARNVPDSMIFEVTVESANRQKAAKIANYLVDTYINGQVEVKFASNDTAVTWLTQRVNQLGKDLETAEKAANSFSAERQIINPDTIEALQLRLVEVRDRMAAINVAIDRTGDSRKSDKKLDVLREQESEISNRIYEQSDSLIKLNQLRREAEASRLIYESFLTRLKETAVQQGIQQADSILLSSAEVAQHPVRPRPFSSMFVGIVVAAIIMASLTIQRETSRSTFLSAEELSASFSIPVLGEVRRLPAIRKKSLIKVLEKNANLPALEDMRGIRAALLASRSIKKGVTLISSSLPNEGKTTQALLVCKALTEVGKSVLLIEADLRRPTLGKYFNFPNTILERGLAQVIVGETSLKSSLLKPKGAGYFVLPAGTRVAQSPASLFSLPGFASLIGDASALFDYVIIDSPPVLSAPDARVIAPLAFQTIYVVQWNRTKFEQIRRGLASFKSVGCNTDNLLLTQVNAATMRKLGTTEYRSAY